ncbi:MAG: FAD-dependent oxidoreductase [Pseudomonadota bacterium]|uniref:FAD-dependent oxidoreductase n=1 Tax=Roseovarius TaxID=74030 RepID=UPI0022A8B03B|nr:FAD-dependent oxidoreductase [Roseovarius sp. EGI FJ00037]MCZ0813854.1 FAD-dependent oxidoreductase [Roseovarius sp. EGI FJ00037]
MSEHVTILGAGVVGLCVATELAARGMALTVVDPNPRPGPHACSWWAAGMLAPFCEAETAEEPVTRLGQEAADWWARAGVEVAHEGSLVVTLGRDRAELDRFARRTIGHQSLSRDALADIEPQLDGRFDRALFFADEAHITPRHALGHLRDSLEASGVAFVGISPATAGLTVDCRGLAAQDVLTDLRGVKGEMAVLRAPDVVLRRPVRLLHPRYPLYIVPRGDGVFMLGATQIESGERNRATLRSVTELFSAAYALHPAFGEAEILEIGVDARPAFADNLPRIRRRGDTIYVNGLFRHGFLLSPALARMVGELLLEGKTPEMMDENQRER